MQDALRRQLAEVVGDAAVDVDDVVRPASLDEVRRVLAACAAVGATVAPLGRDRPTVADVRVAALRLDFAELDERALLLRLGAGTAWANAREAVAAARLAISGLPGVRSDTVGESVARGEVSHRTLAGVDLLTASGELVSAGGRTLKDVVGYDLAGLVLGSGDRLGLILSVTLRLEPAAARSPAEPGPGQWRGDAGIDLPRAFAR